MPRGMYENLPYRGDLDGRGWRCLCFGFSQITITVPSRLITLHLLQIGFTPLLTFIVHFLRYQLQIYHAK